MVHLWTWGDPGGTDGIEELRRAQTEGAVSLLLLIQALERDRSSSGQEEVGVQLLAVSSGAQPVLPDDRLVPGRGTLPPLVKTAPQELPWSTHAIWEPAGRILRRIAIEAPARGSSTSCAVCSGERGKVACARGGAPRGRLARIEPRAAARRGRPPSGTAAAT